MCRRHAIKTIIGFLSLASFFLIGSFPINAQQNPRQSDSTAKNKSVEDVQNADVSITANVTAKELKFEVVPNPTVEFTGKPERKTVWEADRQNLPSSVEPGVTYRNIGIQLRIASRFADIERIVAEALGEVPLTDDAQKKQAPTPISPGSEPQKNVSGKTNTQPLNKQNKPPR